MIDFGDASTQIFHVGEGSVAVPGLVAGLEEAHRRFASMPWPQLVEPAIELAGAGARRDGGAALPAPDPDGDPAARRRRPPDLRRSRPDRDGRLRPDAGAHPRRRLGGGRRADSRARRRHRGLPRRHARAAPHACRRARGPDDARRLPAAARSSPPRSSGSRPPRRSTSAPARSGTATTRRRRSPVAGTTHISVIDADGNAAALSSTLGSGSGIFRGGTQLNNMLGELDVIGHAPNAPGRAARRA